MAAKKRAVPKAATKPPKDRKSTRRKVKAAAPKAGKQIQPENDGKPNKQDEIEAQIAVERAILCQMAGKPRKFLGCWSKKPSYKGELQLIAMCEEYFEACDTQTVRKSYGKNDVRKHPAPRRYTVEGLCLHLGINRSAWVATYSKRYKGCYAWARTRIIESVLQTGTGGNSTFSQFLLQNLDRQHYRTKIDVEVPEGVTFTMHMAGATGKEKTTKPVKKK